MQQDGVGNVDVTSRDDARAQLEALGAFRGKLGEELVCPWWNAPVMGGLLALLWQRAWRAGMTAAL